MPTPAESAVDVDTLGSRQERPDRPLEQNRDVPSLRPKYPAAGTASLGNEGVAGRVSAGG